MRLLSLRLWKLQQVLFHQTILSSTCMGLNSPLTYAQGDNGKSTLTGKVVFVRTRRCKGVIKVSLFDFLILHLIRHTHTLSPFIAVHTSVQFNQLKQSLKLRPFEHRQRWSVWLKTSLAVLYSDSITDATIMTECYIAFFKPPLQDYTHLSLVVIHLTQSCEVACLGAVAQVWCNGQSRRKTCRVDSNWI